MRILLIISLLIATAANAQVYNNEWIDHSKTYYKFKIAQTGLYRIPQTALPAVIAATPAEQFQLWRNGRQVALFTSTAAGALGSTGYIEFFGEKNDGVPDRPLYFDPSFQLSDRVSLETDTAAYFLTVNTNIAANLRFITQANPVAGNVLPAQPYLMYTARRDYRDIINRGRALNLGLYVFSSAYDEGEWWSSNEFRSAVQPSGSSAGSAAQPLVHTFNNLQPFTSGPTASLRVAVAGTAPNGSTGNPRKIRSVVNGSIVFNNDLFQFGASVMSGSVTTSTLTNNTTVNLNVDYNTSQAADRAVAGFIELTYPRNWDFNNATHFEFSLPASGAQYIEITNFNAGAAAPVLYDLTNNRRYVADIAVAGKYRFVLPADAARNFVLVSQANGIGTVSQLQVRNFVNFANTANQGDYLLITHSSLRNGGDPVEQYRAYRSSVAGGSYNARIYDIDELTDQFAFGIRKHPLSVRNFLRYSRATFSTAPKQVFIIGKGVTYDEYAYNQGTAQADQLNLVPTFGYPGSDIMLAAEGVQPVPATPIGRLSAITPAEVSVYLAKMIAYEAAQRSPLQTIAEKEWMKNVVHVAGANDAFLDAAITGRLSFYKTIIQDTSYGGRVYDFNKATTGPATAITDALLRSLLKNGIGVLTYFGHGSSTILDYNLPDVATWDNNGRYPLFLMLGCNVGNIFSYDAARLSVRQTLSEKYILAAQSGGIGLLASTHFGTYGELDVLADKFYTALGRTKYNQPIGEVLQESARQLLPNANSSMLMRLHLEQHILHGDPALRANSFPKPDYVIEEPKVIINPAFISVADTAFDVKAYIHNIGKATGNSSSTVTVEVKRRYPDGSMETVLTRNIVPAVRNLDSISFRLPIVPTRDKGENRLIITVDANNRYDELSETNNSVEKVFFIFEDELRPVYPYNFSIINRNNAKLFASTADPLLGNRSYLMELDTTALFNSPMRITRNITSAGGLIEFDPGITYQDSTVYYWRVAIAPTSGTPRWNNSNFVFINGPTVGFNQSHFYQHTQSLQERMFIDTLSRQWRYGNGNTSLLIRNKIFRPGDGDTEFSISVNGLTPIVSACVGTSLIFNVFDPVTMRPWFNQVVPSTVQSGTGGGFMGSGPVCANGRQYNFEWTYADTVNRRRMRDFLDALPNDAVVVVRSISGENAAPYIDEWRDDRNVYGVGNTLYDRLRSFGFVDIDSFSTAKAWAFVFKKNNASVVPRWQFTQTAFDAIAMNVLVPSRDTLGYVTSPKFGPVRAWQELRWRGASLETPSTDNVNVALIGVRSNGQEDVLLNLGTTQQTVDISSISAATYPYLRLRLTSLDNVNQTPYQLRWWRLIGTPVPEGALAGNLRFNFTDTLDAGQPLLIGIPFKNVSDVAFSAPVKVNIVVRDRNNQQTPYTVPALKAVVPGDTAMLLYQVNTQSLTGSNTVFVDINPDNDQPEYAHFNNFFYRSFFVKGDVFRPSLDVTFDGVRILNRDIVSAKPHIMVKLRDESRFLPLDDTSLVTILLKYPNGSTRRFRFGTDTLRFIPATGGTNNEASAEFSPVLLQDGEYELIVTGKDRSGNTAGNLEYRVLFQVYNKPMISNMFNYPNPFTTSTSFVFTLTGSEVPQNLRIQVLTVTGKIVREITKDELGPLNIGRNITSFKWDGTDQYGQKLGNGVYLYRVITNLNGKSLDKFSLDKEGNRDGTDKYFNKGYGKMYLMR